METKNKLFAFKLATREEAKKAAQIETNGGKWKAREGAPIAGCTDPTGFGDYRYSALRGTDNGIWC